MDTQSLLVNVVLAGLVTYVVEFIKRASWFPWMTAQTKTVNRWVSFVLAGALAIGITVDWNSAQGVLVIGGLTWANIGHGLFEWAKQWMMQQAWYDKVVQTKSTPVIEVSGGVQ
jgi:hypothetical protein